MVLSLFDRVLSLKQTMGAYCLEHLADLYTDTYAFKKQYNLTIFASSDLNAWECQALFSDVVDRYRDTIRQRIANQEVFVQAQPQGWSIERYKKDTYRLAGPDEYSESGKILEHAKGDVRRFDLIRRRTDLTAMVKYLAYVPLATFNPDDLKNAEIRERMQHYRNEKPEIWRRACQLAQAIQTRVIGTVKKIRFATGTHRRDPKQSRSQVIHDPSNAEYQWWYKLRMGSGRAKKTFIYLPLTFNPKYMKPGDLRLDAVHVCYVRHGRQFMVGATYEGKPPKFREPWVKSHGIDVNTKTNLLALSDGRFFDYDRQWVEKMISLIDHATRFGTQEMSIRDKARLAKYARQNEWHIKRRLHGFLEIMEAEGVTDLVMEDFNLQDDATFFTHPALKVKYSRLLRLLRLSHIKDWMNSQAEKRGIRVHLTPHDLTSQECPKCHRIDSASRVTQAVFSCVHCGYTGPADPTAGTNIQCRVIADVLRGPDALLHEKDSMGRWRPKPGLTQRYIRDVVERQLYAGLTPGDFTEPLAPGKTKSGEAVSRSSKYVLKLHP